MKKNQIERAELVRAMEIIIRHINDEEIIEAWLMNGVADGDIDEKTTLKSIYDNYCADDKGFQEIMACFCRSMRYMVEDAELDVHDRRAGNGMLYCDNLVSNCWWWDN